MTPSRINVSASPTPPLQAETLLAQGDTHWAARPIAWRERQLAMPWPPALLEAFALRMASHGLCVSRALMTCDRQYALQQLSDAHNLADENLRLMAVQLFRHFESRQSGIPSVH